jgi:peptidoglycan/xylan/chitin deacetylase (PgdA/CDA1 family)
VASGWKRAAEVLLAKSGAVSAIRKGSSPSTLILAYHNIVPAGEAAAGDLSLHLDQEVFGNQLDLLMSCGEVITLAEGATRTSSSGDGLRIVITFDDAYRGAMTAGVAELQKRDLPATVFVPTGLVGTDGFWWDRLGAGSGTGLELRIREEGLTLHRGDGDRILQWAKSVGLTIAAMPGHSKPVSERELLHPLLYGGITYGAHTWSHANLAELTQTEAHAEMKTSKEWLVSRTDRYVDWLAYPYGLHSASAATIAGELFVGALRVDGGLYERRGSKTSPPHTIPRVNVPRDLTLEGLSLRLAGLL